MKNEFEMDVVVLSSKQPASKKHGPHLKGVGFALSQCGQVVGKWPVPASSWDDPSAIASALLKFMRLLPVTVYCTSLRTRMDQVAARPLGNNSEGKPYHAVEDFVALLEYEKQGLLSVVQSRSDGSAHAGVLAAGAEASKARTAAVDLQGLFHHLYEFAPCHTLPYPRRTGA